MPDGALAVREAITFDFRGRHNGIFRTIPVRYTRAGLDWTLRLEGITALDERFEPLRTEVTRPGRYVRIQAWVPGAQDTRRTVTLLYRVRRGLITVDDHEELYWNVTGDEWHVPIREAEAVIAGPPAVSSDEVRVLAFTGPRGAVGRDWVEERAERFITVKTTRALGPREGLTVAVAWPPGTVGRPPLWRRAGWAVADNWPLALPPLTLAVGLACWRRSGRDPGRERSVKPEYAPPPELTPGEAGTLVDERADPRDVVATLVDLAVRGFVRIEEERGEGGAPDFAVHRLRPLSDPGLKPFEQLLLLKLFGAARGSPLGNDLVLMSQVRRDYDADFGSLRRALYRTAVTDRLFPASPDAVRRGWAVAGGGVAAAGILYAFMAQGGSALNPWPLAVGLVGSGLVLLAFSPAMPRRTWRGARLLAHVRGFQEFLERAERDRLARMPADTLHRLLPWAIALGVSERWIQSFEGLEVAPPAWYQGPSPFTLSGFDHSVGTLSRACQDALATTRRAADGGGWGGGDGGGVSGGSSGGGMGGGGGGTF